MVILIHIIIYINYNVQISVVDLEKGKNIETERKINIGLY